MKLVNTLPEDKWRHFVEHHPAGNIFHTPEMFQVFARTKEHQPTLWAAVDTQTEDVLALLLPVQISLFNGWLRHLTSRAVVYGSILSQPGPRGEKALGRLLSAYTRKTDRSILFTELRNLSDLGNIKPLLKEYRFIYEDHLNFLIDLARPIEEVKQDIGRRTRKQIRQGLRRGEVIIEVVEKPDQVAFCYKLLRWTYTAARIPLADQSLFKATFEILYPKNMVRFLLARVGNTYVGTSIELLYKDVVYGWYGGVDRSYSQYTPNELLMWHILQWSVENGYRTYDFGGAGKPDEEYGVRDFKAKFGGELVNFGRFTCVNSPSRLKLSKLGYQLYRKFLRSQF